MKKLNFQKQARLALLVVLVCLFAGNITEISWFANVGHIFAGLLFILNPVWPAAWNKRDPKKMKTEARIAGVLIVLLGIFGHFHG